MSMWKKTDDVEPGQEKVAPTQSFSPAPAPKATTTGQAVIGSSLSVKGDLSGEEDLTIQGRVEGKVDLKKNNVTIGRQGRVKADIYGKVIVVEGDVQGNLFGGEKITIRQSGNVRGNLTAPRVTLEDGARLKGSVDMEGVAAEKREPQPEPARSSSAQSGRSSWKDTPEVDKTESSKTGKLSSKS